MYLAGTLCLGLADGDAATSTDLSGGLSNGARSSSSTCWADFSDGGRSSKSCDTIDPVFDG